MLTRNAFHATGLSINVLRRAVSSPHIKSSAQVMTMTSSHTPKEQLQNGTWTSSTLENTFTLEGHGKLDLALGLRSTRPPDTISSSSSLNMSSGNGPKKDVKQEEGVSDSEWEIRTGRALFVLQETLPEFFKIGLVTHVDKSTGAPVLGSQSSNGKMSTGSILPGASLTDFLKDQEQPHEGSALGGTDFEPIYSPKVKLEYMPPVELPAPFPRVLHFEGLPWYLASASFMRHTMNALYSDLTVTLVKVALDVPPSSSSNDKKENEGSSEERREHGEAKKLRVREKRLLVRFMVSGNARVSGSMSEWEVDSTYIFSPVTGLIHKQVINSIQPAPHLAVYDSMRKLFAFGGAGGIGKGPAHGPMCNGHSK